jgi:hypothetical protein
MSPKMDDESPRAIVADGGRTPVAAPELNDFDPAAAYLDQLGEGSRRTMREALKKIAGLASNGSQEANDFPWHTLRIEAGLA